jgi:deazaflavin-dependent oxidoreductase (nitroreductase family)
MPITGEYVPSTWSWVADQVAEYEASGGSRANTLLDTGIPIIVLTTLGASSGKVRKLGLMRVEHDGEYALVASKGGDPKNPAWYANIVAHPHVMIQDGPEPHDYDVREVTGVERDAWWARAAAVYPPYLEYQQSTDRLIPVLVATPVAG